MTIYEYEEMLVCLEQLLLDCPDRYAMIWICMHSNETQACCHFGHGQAVCTRLARCSLNKTHAAGAAHGGSRLPNLLCNNDTSCQLQNPSRLCRKCVKGSQHVLEGLKRTIEKALIIIVGLTCLYFAD